MISAAQYQQLNNEFQEVDLTEINIPEHGRTLAIPGRTITICNDNLSEPANRKLVEQIMASGLLPSEAVTYSSIDFTYCVLNENFVAQKVNETSIILYQIADNNEIISKKTENYQFNNQLILFSTNNTRDYSDRYSGKQILKSLQETIRNTLRRQPSLSALEWRFEGIEVYEEEEINDALRALYDAGFQARIDPPYNIVKENGETCISCQPLSVRIADVINPSRIGGIFTSALDIQREWRNGNPAERLPLQRPSIITVDQTLEMICKQLKFLAGCHPLVNRAACSVRYLGSNDLPALLQRLTDLGYSATLDTPFMNHQHSFMIWEEQYVIIELP